MTWRRNSAAADTHTNMGTANDGRRGMKLTKDQERLLNEAGELMVDGKLVKAPESAPAAKPSDKEPNDDQV